LLFNVRNAGGNTVVEMNGCADLGCVLKWLTVPFAGKYPAMIAG